MLGTENLTKQLVDKRLMDAVGDCAIAWYSNGSFYLVICTFHRRRMGDG